MPELKLPNYKDQLPLIILLVILWFSLPASCRTDIATAVVQHMTHISIHL